MKKTLWWLIILLSAALVAAIVYNAMPNRGLDLSPGPPAPPPLATPAPAPAPPPEEPGIQYPVEANPEGKPLPALGQSDPALKEDLGKLWDPKTIARSFNVDDFVRRVVATVDNLPRETVALRLRPLKSAPGQFAVTGKDEDYAIGPRNAARYAPYVRLAESVDARQLVALYRRFYPLFQEAYRDLGYPNGYFNDRLVAVIDHLLAAPDIDGPVKLVQPKVMYKFADPDLEAQSAGHKIMIRMGRENEAKVKGKLHEIRAELIRNAPKPQPGRDRSPPGKGAPRD